MNPLVRPFAALRPDAEHAAAVIAPPYDVVSTEEARALVSSRPNSFLHLSRPEIGFTAHTDPFSEAVYRRARENLERLKALGLLVRETAPAYYAYRLSAGSHEQTGMALTVSLGAYEAGRVRKHERTRPAKEQDRVRNMLSLNAQTGPVLSAHRADPTIKAMLARIKRQPPLFEVEGQHGVMHTLWRVDDARSVAAVSAAFERSQPIYIADGHHRSAAAARAAAQLRTPQTSATASHEYFLTVVFPHDELQILGYHRVVKDLNGLSVETLIERLTEDFDVTASAAPVAPGAPATFGMFADGRWYRLALRTARIPANDPVARLDVSLLQARILAPLLGVGDPRTDPRIDFIGGVRGPAELERRVRSGQCAIAFSLYPTAMDQLMAVADAGKLMPPKSTWFEPKLADGLLSHVLD